MFGKRDTLGELIVLVRRCGLKINSTEELKEVLQLASKAQDPEAARLSATVHRQEMIKSVGFGVPFITLVAAVIVSLMLIAAVNRGNLSFNLSVAGLAIIWGGAAAICVTAIRMALNLLGRGQPAPPAGASSGPTSPFQAEPANRLGHAITTGKES